MAKRKRDIQLKVRVTPEERAMIEAKSSAQRTWAHIFGKWPLTAMW